MKKKYKYSYLFALTGFLLVLYSFIIKNNFPNKNLGVRFSAGDFYESDLYVTLGLIGILFAILYYAFYRIDKIQLRDKWVARHYWLSLPTLILLALIPIMECYFPINKYEDSIIMQLINFGSPISMIMFLVSIFFALSNFIYAIYVYFTIKRSWNE